MSNNKENPDKFPRPVVLPDGTVFTAYGVSKASPPITPLSGRGISPAPRPAPTTHKPAVPVDWAFWPASRRVKRDEAIALSLDLDPHSLYSNIDGHINPEFCPDNATAILYLKRLSLLAACDSRTNILLSDFAAWASINLTPIPQKLIALARKQPDAPEQIDAPVTAGNAAPLKADAADERHTHHKKGAKWTDEDFQKLLADSKSMTQEQLAEVHGVTRQRISALLTQAAEQFETKSSTDLSVNPLVKLVKFNNRK